MSEPIVLIQIQNGNPGYTVSGSENIRVVEINWDDLENDGRGELSEVYKEVWGLPEDLRSQVLPMLIALIQRRFPIVAMFVPEAWINNCAVPIDTPVRFDVTEKVLNQGPDYMDNLQDDDYPTDELAEDLLDRHSHNGPFRVEVKDDVMEFLFAAEYEGKTKEKRQCEKRSKR